MSKGNGVWRLGVNSLVKTIAGSGSRPRMDRAWSWTSQEIQQFQQRRLRTMARHAVRWVPYYRDRKEIYAPGAMADVPVRESLARLPILDKQTVKTLNEEFFSQRPALTRTYHSTSGTSGTPLRLPATLWERGTTEVALRSWYKRIFGTAFPRSLVLSGMMVPPDQDRIFWLDRLTRTAYLSIYSISAGNREAILSLISDWKPQRVTGYPSAIFELARVTDGALRDIAGYCTATTTAEVLQPEWRETITDNLCHDVRNFYGSQEGAHLVIECEAHALHIHPVIGLVEVVDEAGEAVGPGDVGRILVTGLVRRSMPLFRYDLGDMLRSTGMRTDCECGLEWPTVGEVQGRSDDMVLTRDGRRIALLGYSLFKDLPGIIEAQLIQRGYDDFVCRMVLSDGEEVPDEAAAEMVRKRLLERLQAPATIDFVYLQEIPRTAMGKFRVVVREFEPA